MTNKRTKLFLSYASEDKPSIADPLAEALKVDFDVWYDRDKLTLGDSLFAKISEGLGQTDFGVVIFSKHFFAKKWTQNELDGLVSLEQVKRKVILPIWHEVGFEEVKQFNSIIAGRIGIPTSVGIPAIVAAIHAAVNAARSREEIDKVASIRSRILNMDGALVSSQACKQLLESREGVIVVRESVERFVSQLRSIIEASILDTKKLAFTIKDGVNNAQHRVFGCAMPYKLDFSIEYFNDVINSAARAHMSVGIWRVSKDSWGTTKSRSKKLDHCFLPKFFDDKKLAWISGSLQVNDCDMADFLIDQMTSNVEAAHKENSGG